MCSHRWKRRPLPLHPIYILTLTHIGRHAFNLASPFSLFFSLRGRVLEGLLREKKAGRLPGLCGRLGDLGTIDDKYDVAVSTACSALNNIVCEDFETAQVKIYS